MVPVMWITSNVYKLQWREFNWKCLVRFLSLLTLAVSRWAHSSLVGEAVVSWQLKTPISSGFALKLTHSGQQLMIPYKKSLVTRSLRTVRLYFEEILMIELKERTYI